MNQLFFKINLNKFGELRQQIERENKVFKNTIIWFAVFTVVMFGALYTVNHLLNMRVESRRDLLRDINTEIQTYQDSGEYLSTNDLSRLADLSTARIFWANKLIALSEITTEKIAITHFTYQNGVLSLHGITQVDRDVKEFDLIHDFINDLYQNDDFNQDFSEIRFVRSSRDREGDVQILRFQIDCVGVDYSRRERRL